MKKLNIPIQPALSNADRIRSMTDEELRDFLYEPGFSDICKEGCGECYYNGDCGLRLLKWLQQPAEGVQK